VETPKSSESVSADAHSLEIRPDDPAGAADYNRLNIAVPVDQHSYLPVGFIGELGQLARKILGDDLTRRDSLLTKLLKAVDLVGLESLGVPLDAANT
jgi:hypothetical protein